VKTGEKIYHKQQPYPHPPVRLQRSFVVAPLGENAVYASVSEERAQTFVATNVEWQGPFALYAIETVYYARQPKRGYARVLWTQHFLPSSTTKVVPGRRGRISPLAERRAPALRLVAA
jgi:hypothetical protein